MTGNTPSSAPRTGEQENPTEALRNQITKARAFLEDSDTKSALSGLAQTAIALKDPKRTAEREAAIRSATTMYGRYTRAEYTFDRPAGGQYEIMNTYNQLNQIRNAVAGGKLSYADIGIDSSDFDTMYRNATILAAYHLVREYPSNPISMRTDRVKDMLASVGATLEDIAFSSAVEREDIRLKAMTAIADVRFLMENPYGTVYVSETLNKLNQAIMLLEGNGFYLYQVLSFSGENEIKAIQKRLQDHIRQWSYFISNEQTPASEPIPTWSEVEPNAYTIPTNQRPQQIGEFGDLEDE